MKRINTLLKAALVTATISASETGLAHAGDLDAAKSMKPLQGVSFAAGKKRAVGYFYNEGKHCKLVVTVAEPLTGNGQTFDVFRHEANVEAGRSDQFDLSEGQSLEFACAIDAQTMRVKSVENIASRTVK